MVFAFDSYYPSGGMNDFVNSYDDLAEAKELCERLNKDYDCTQILNTVTEEIVYEGFN
jgi:hypothetical protein